MIKFMPLLKNLWVAYSRLWDRHFFGMHEQWRYIIYQTLGVLGLAGLILRAAANRLRKVVL